MSGWLKKLALEMTKPLAMKIIEFIRLQMEKFIRPKYGK